jgi:putative Mn2+ efflux pump MntP
MFLVAASILIGDAVISSPTRGESGWAWVRVAFLIALIISLATGAFLAALMTIGMFFAEYAFMIKNVPPADSKKFVDTLAYS